MSRKEYPPLTPVQADWLRGWARAQDRVLARVMRRLTQLHHDGGSPLYRRVYTLRIAVQSIAQDRDVGGLWNAGPWRGNPRDLTAEQREHLAGIAANAACELKAVTDYFDRAGSPCRQLSTAVRHAADSLHAIGVHLHYLATPHNTAHVAEAEPAPDPSIYNGAGI